MTNEERIAYLEDKLNFLIKQIKMYSIHQIEELIKGWEESKK